MPRSFVLSAYACAKETALASEPVPKDVDELKDLTFVHLRYKDRRAVVVGWDLDQRLEPTVLLGGKEQLEAEYARFLVGRGGRDTAKEVL